jgi:hypothetical protein
MNKHCYIDERSLAFDRLTAQKLLAEPALVNRGLANLERWLNTCSPSVRPVFLEWRSLLNGPLEVVIAILLSRDEYACRLRQSSPFAGLLTTAERTSIIKHFHSRESLSA